MNNDNEKDRPWPHGYEDTALCAGLCLVLWFIALMVLIFSDARVGV
ncbi:hypothetical protein [uncultured Gilvimarinus sp.]